VKTLFLACTSVVLVLFANAAAAQTQPADTVSAATAPAPARPAAARRPRVQRNLITQEEIEAAQMATAYDVVQRLRPQWLHNRGGPVPDPDGSVEVRVYYNAQPMGGVEVLKDYTAGQVATLRYFDPISARTTFGPGNGRGVIVVTGR
jgi:hypothetical protein